MSDNPNISVVIPVYNEEQNILPLLERLLPALSGHPHEVIFVNDGSRDHTVSVIKKAAQGNKNIKLVSFFRNFGHQMALTAGYEAANGGCVITMDSDLQDPPEIIPDMIRKWREGARVVYARREKREVDSIFKKTTAALFYRLINLLSDTPIPEEVGDYRLLDRSVVQFLNGLPERSRFLRGLVAWGGFPAAFVYFRREKRLAGVTHYTITKMVNFALEGITTFSIKPLRIASYIGFAAASLGFLGILYAVIGKIFLPSYWVTGWTALFVGIMFLGGVQLITIGIIGEYIGKIYREVQRRPQYLIEEKINL